MTEAVQVSSAEGVMEVVLDRPKANAIDSATSREMGRVFREFRDDDSLRVAIVTGGGERFFSAGWDLKAAAAGESVTEDYGLGGFGGIQEHPGLNKPIIAAVNGMAVGGGFELALSCDLILAAQSARFSLPEIRAGTVADAASLRLPRRIPYHIAMEMLLLGRWMEPEEAARWGLVNEVVEDSRLMERAREIAAILAAGPPLVFAAIKEVMRDCECMPFQDAMNRIVRRQIPAVDMLYGSEDHQEGSRAFAEKRDPVWKGI